MRYIFCFPNSIPVLETDAYQRSNSAGYFGAIDIMEYLTDSSGYVTYCMMVYGEKCIKGNLELGACIHFSDVPFSVFCCVNKNGMFDLEAFKEAFREYIEINEDEDTTILIGNYTDRELLRTLLQFVENEYSFHIDGKYKVILRTFSSLRKELGLPDLRQDLLH